MVVLSVVSQIPSGAPMADCALTVLLADGDDTFASSLLPHPDRYGLQLTSASTARAAWQWSLGQSFDVMVLDRDLPDGDALGLVTLLRDHGINTPVIVLAAAPDVNHALALGRLGISDYLAKPVTTAELVESIRRAAGPARVSSVAPVDDTVAWLVATLAGIQAEQRVAKCGRGEPELSPPKYAPDLGSRLTSGRLNFVEFLTASELLRCHLRRLTPALALTSKLACLASERRSRMPTDPRLDAIERMVLDAGLRWRETSPSIVCARLGISPVSLWRLLIHATRHSFHGVRRAIVVRSSLPMLAGTFEHVRQIGFMAGYASHSRFDHDVRAVLGLSPSALRKLVCQPARMNERNEQGRGTAS